ncbi:MAG: hypothetical protein K2L94_02450 [Alphaproteobacteria bacterium]|nr:hypothetical protein [Alphaproteobacteria bacterium]
MLFVVTQDNIRSPSLADLINNIAASLLSIPLVFLLYDYSNSRVSKRLSQTMAQNMADKVNLLLMNLTILMRHVAGVRGKLTLESLNRMDELTVSRIAKNMKIGATDVADLRKYRDELDDLIYKYGRANIISVDRVQELSAMARDLSHLINEHKFYSNRKITAKYIASIITRITDWLDSDAEMALHFQQLLQQGAIGPEK